MRPLFLESLIRTSSLELAPPTSNSDTEGSVKNAGEHSTQPRGSPDESYTEIQQPHGAIFRI